MEVPKEYISSFNRRIEKQLYSELRRDYSFPRNEGQIIFHAASKEVPPGVPVEEMHLVAVKLTI